MCGIVYGHSIKKRPVNNFILDQFDAQRQRGTQGFGLFDGQENNIVRATTENKILDWLCKYDSNLILFHHRMPTSTSNTKKTAHPFATKKYFGDNQYIMVHNGILSNHRDLKEKHEKLGIKYSSVQDDGFNDSEALLWDLALYLEGKQSGLHMKGDAAFICIKLVKNKLDKMYFARNSYRPLNMKREDGDFALSSEGAGEPITPDMLYTYNYQIDRLTSKKLVIPSNYEVTHNWSDNYTYSQKQLTSGTLEERWEYPDDDDWYTSAQGKTYDEWLEEHEVDDKRAREIEYLAYKYLKHHNGKFEAAYDELEVDYMVISEDPTTVDEYEAMMLIEDVMDWFVHNPEYLSEHSVSTLYTQTELANVLY